MSSTDPRIAAIRFDPVVGRGTCTDIDEAYTDEEILALLDVLGATTPEEAVRAARSTQRVRDEVYRDIRGTVF